MLKKKIDIVDIVWLFSVMKDNQKQQKHSQLIKLNSMTKDEAIKYLKQLYPNGGHCWLDEQRIEAIGMAVKALQEEPVKIKKGCKYRCLSDIVNRDTGNISFIGNKIYLAPEDDTLVSEENGWLCDTSENISSFELVEEPVSEQNLSNIHKTVKNCKESASEELEEEPTIPDIVDEHYWEMLGEEPVSEWLEEASKSWLRPQLDKSYANYGEAKMMELTHFDGYAMLDAIEFGAQWQKEKDAILPKVWNRENLDDFSYQTAYDLSSDWANETPTWHDVEMACKLGAKWQKENLWKHADGDDLPEIDREVIALLNNGKVVFAHRPDPKGWDAKSIITEKVEHYTPETYDKGGWNQPNVKWWLDVDKLPNMEG